MFRATAAKAKTKTRHQTRVPYVRAAAEKIGVTPGHLHHVVTGQRQSPRVLAAYRAYVATAV